MKGLFGRRSVRFIEPTELFEQLEERVVLDATVDQPPDQAQAQDVQAPGQDSAPVQEAAAVSAPSATEPGQVPTDSAGDPGADVVQTPPIDPYAQTVGAGESAPNSTADQTVQGTLPFLWNIPESDAGSAGLAASSDNGTQESGSIPSISTDAVPDQIAEGAVEGASAVHESDLLSSSTQLSGPAGAVTTEAGTAEATSDADQSSEPASAQNDLHTNDPRLDAIAPSHSESRFDVTDVSRDEGPRVLLVSSEVQGAETLMEAAQDGVITVLYDGRLDSPSDLVADLRTALDGQKAQSIALAVHDVGDSAFRLTGSVTVSSEELQTSSELQVFWHDVGELLTPDGRIDILACNLTAGEAGMAVVSQIEQLSGHDAAASDDATGNGEYGADWLLETGNVDLVSTYFLPDRISEFQGRLAQIDLASKTGWTTVMYGASFDPARDLQANVKGQDLLGDNQHGVLYTAYDDNGTAGDFTDDVVAYRIRLDGDDGKGNLVPFIFIGIDADLNGSLDIFLGLNPNTDSVVIFNPGSGANTAPNNTTYAQANPWTVGYNAKAPSQYAWGFDTAVPNSSYADNYDFSLVSDSTDPHYLPADASGSLTADLDRGGVNDRFVTFAISFADLQTELFQEKGITVTPSSPMRYVLGTATQDNSFNSDMGGIGKEFSPNSSTTWEQLGIFSPVLSLSNMFPVGTPDTYSTYEATPVSGDVLTNDTDPNVDDTLTVAASYVGTSATAHGSVTLNGDGTFTYTPSAGYTGTDAFTYKPYDGRDAAIQTVTVTVNIAPDPAANNLPVAVDDSVSTSEDVSVTGNVLNNDTDADDDPLSAKLATGPSHGVVTLNADGSFVYTPSKDYYGTDTFTYFAHDGKNDSAIPATVTVTVNPVPDSASAEGNEDSHIIFALLESDADGSISFIGTPAHGTVTINSDGKTVDYLPGPDYNGTDNFTYTITYPDGSTFTSTATVTVLPLNDAPVARTDSVTTNEDVDVTITAGALLANDTDVDGDALTLITDPADSVHIVTDPQHGTLTYDSVTSSFTYAPDADYSGADSFTYVIADRNNPDDITRLTDTGTVNITVQAVNDAPTAVDDAYTISEDPATALTGNVLTLIDGAGNSDSDPDGPSALTAQLVTGPSHGTLVLNGDGTFSYTPEANFNGTDTFIYRAWDGAAGDTAVVTITVSSVNDLPVTADDAYNTSEDTPVTITAADLRNNDTDVETPTASLVVSLDPAGFSKPAHGILTDNLDGTFTYTPEAGFSGTDGFIYKVTDADGGTSEGTVLITVTAAPRPPTAQDDAFTLNEDSSFSGNVVANDFDPDGDSLTVSLVSGLTNGGTLVLNANGTFTYTPAANWSGTDGFTYKVTDATGNTDTAVVTLTVNAVNDAPAAANDTFVTDEDAPLVITPASLLGNDTDIDGGTLTVQSVTNGSHGTVTYDPVSGNYTYTPDPNYGGTDTFTYVVSDGNGGTATGTVTVTINAKNDPPDAIDDSVVTRENGSVTFDPKANDTDADGDSLEIVPGSIGTPSHGTAVLNADGTITYTPAARFAGTDTFTYNVKDPSGATDSVPATVTVTVSDAASTPAANDQTETTPEDTPVTQALDASDPDSQPLTYTVLTNPSNGTVTIDADGNFTYTPNDDFYGTDTFVYRASDGTFGDTATVTINVSSVNDPPTAGTDNLTVDEGSSITFSYASIAGPANDLLDNDSDSDGPSGLSVDPATFGTPAHGILTYDPTAKTFTYTPDAGYSGSDSFAYTVSDGDETAVGTVIVTVNPQANAPIAGNDELWTAEDSPVTVPVGNLLANDSDPDGTTPTVVAGSFSDPPNGTLVYDPVAKTVTYTPDADFNGDDSFTYRISDGVAESTATVAVHVQPVNDPPVATDDNLNATEDAAVEFIPAALLGNDSDVDGGTLSIQSTTNPSHGTVTFDAVSGKYTYTPDADYYGIDTISYVVSDGLGGTDTGTVTITVTAANDPPVAANDSASGSEDTLISGNVLANDTDADGDKLTVTPFSGNLTHGTVVLNADGTFSYAPEPNWSGTDGFNYTVSDGHGGTSTATVTLTVSAVNDAPVAVPDSETLDLGSQTKVDIIVLANDTDTENDPLTIVSFDAASSNGGTVTQKSGDTFEYTPPSGFTGTDTFTYTISDGTDTSQTTVTITVTGNEPPRAYDNVYVKTGSNQNISGNVITDVYPSPVGDADSDTETAQAALTVDAITESDFTLSTNGAFSFTASGWGSTHTWYAYTLHDANGATDTAILWIAQDQNGVDEPIPVKDLVTTPQNTAKIIDVVANDWKDPGSTAALTVNTFTQASNGTVTPNGDGTLSYTPNAGFTGRDTFTYTLTGGTLSGTVEVIVTGTSGGANQPPTAIDDSVSTPEGTPTTINVLTYLDGSGQKDSDPNGDTLTVTAVAASGTVHGTAGWTPNGDVTYTPVAGWTGTDTFTYTVTDGNGGTDTGTLTITVTATANNAPVAADDSLTTTEGVALVFNQGALLANDTDADGDALTVASFDAVTSQDGSVAKDADGIFTYTPKAGFSGTDTFTYTIQDVSGAPSTATVTVTVNPEPNTGPVAVDDNVTVNEDSSIKISPLANDFDAEDDTLSIVSGSVSDPPHGSVVDNGDGTLTYVPDADWNGTDTFTYTASDGSNNSSATVTVVVKPVNDPPVATDNGPYNVTDAAGATVSGNVLTDGTADSDVDGPSALTAQLVSGPAYGTVVLYPDGAFTYTPNTDNTFTGTDTFVYRAWDGSASDTATVSINVTHVNNPPTAGTDSLTVDEGSSVTVSYAAIVGSNNDLLDNDTDAETPGNLSIDPTSFSASSHGTVTYDTVAETVTYTPDPEFSGSDNFTYVLSDGDPVSPKTVTGTVYVTVNSVNDAPVANDDSVTSNEDSSVAGQVLANDNDPDGDSLTVTLGTGPSDGNLALNADGAFTYTPNENWSGTDSFTYQVDDGRGGTDVATVTITVNQVNDPPVAVDDTYSVQEDASLTRNVLTKIDGGGNKDSDADSGDVLTVTPFSGSTSHGTLNLTADGTFTYTPNADYNGPDSFTYTVSDGHGGTDTGTVTISVAPENDPPTANPDSVTTDEGNSITFAPKANDSDVDNDALTITAINPDPANPLHGTIGLNADQTVTYTPNADFNGTDTFKYTLSDGNGGSDEGTITVTVNPVNSAPVADDQADATAEDTPIVDRALDASDPDGTTPTYTVVTGPAHGTIEIKPNGTYTYTPNPNFHGTDGFVYRASDGTLADTAKVTITVNPVNDPPTAVNDGYTIQEDSATPLSGNVITKVDASGDSDSDVEGDSLSVVAFTGRAGHGNVVLNTDGTFTYTPDADYSGSDSFSYTLSDGADTSTGTVYISVTPTNDPPTAQDDSFPASEDSAVSGNVLDNDTDPDGDGLSAILKTDPSHGNLVWNGDGTFTYTPDPNFNGIDTFTYQAQDPGGALSEIKTVTINVTAVNDAPQANPDSASGPEDTILTGNVRVNDTDADGDTLTTSILTGPAHGAVVLNSDGTFSYTPDRDYNGPDSFTYTADDGHGGTSTGTASITVTPVNDDPVAKDESFTTVQNQAVGGNVLSNDTDPDNPAAGDVLTATTVSGPQHGTLVLNTDGTFTYTPDTGFSGTDGFVYEAQDGKGGSDQASVEIQVNAANVPPVAKDDVAAGNEDTTISGNVLTNDTDADGDPLAVVSPGTYSTDHGQVVLKSDGTFTYTPDADYNGYDGFTYQVTDPSVAGSTATVEIYVNPVNDPPTAVADSVETLQDTAVTVNVLANDIDPDGDTLTVFAGGVGRPAHGTAAVNADGTITYTPDSGYTGADGFTYLILDEERRSSSATVSVQVKPAGAADQDLAPVANPDSFNTAEDTPVSGNVLANDTDAEDGQPGTAVLLSGTSHGSVTLQAGGNFTYTPASNFNGIDTFTYRAEDSHGNVSTTTVTINVAIDNDPPVTSPDFVSGSKNEVLSSNVLSNDYDPEQTALRSQYVLLSGPLNGDVVLNQDGNFVYTPNSNFTGTDGFSYTAIDRQGGTAQDAVTVTVTGPADPPADPPPPGNPPSNETASPVTIPLEARPDGGDNGSYGGLSDLYSPSLGWVPRDTAFGKTDGVIEAGDKSFSTNHNGLPGPEGGKASSPGGSALDEMFNSSEPGLDAMLGALRDHDQGLTPEGRAGTGSPITSLTGYAPEVVKGKRLTFEAEELGLWDSFDDKSPTQVVGGSQSQETPMEGYAAAVEAGKRLNFSYYPIRETLAFKLDDFTVADLLGV